MTKLLNAPVVYLTLSVIGLILFWSVVVRFTWLVAVALAAAAVITFVHHWRGGRSA